MSRVSGDFHVAEYAILSYTRNSGFWLDNWRSACPERLFLLPKSRYFMKAEVVNIQTRAKGERAWKRQYIERPHP
jgi:hypothetical protein